MEEEALLVRVGEIALKSGPPRRRFESALTGAIRSSLRYRKIPFTLSRETGRIIVRVPKEFSERAISYLSKVFGIVSLSKITVLDFSDLADLAEKCAALVAGKPGSFAVRAKRGSSNYPFNSVDIGREVGSAISAKTKSKVDLDNPEFELFVEVRERNAALVYFGTVPAIGGLPWACEGRVLALIDGTDESALAALEVARRGCEPIFVLAGGTVEKAASAISRIREYLPREKARFFLAPPEGLPSVSGETGGEIPEDSNFRPLLFLSEQELAGKMRLLSPPAEPEISRTEKEVALEWR
jgi:thiamine biosynthesis protein ThiI